MCITIIHYANGTISALLPRTFFIKLIFMSLIEKMLHANKNYIVMEMERKNWNVAMEQNIMQ